MADTRTLKLSILADVDNLRRNLDTADREVKGFGDKLGKWSKMAATAFAAAGAAAVAYAGKLAIDGVKAAVEDAAAQEKLARSLKNVTGATDKQIAAVEDYITQTTLATGITDDELRPSLDRLVRSTKNITEAQKLQALALDISAGTSKSLESVTTALSKAYEGSNAALGKLGVGLDKAEIKTASFDYVAAKLADTFRNQASTQAETFAGKMQRLQVAFDEGKETVGSFTLTAITPMVETFVKKVIPAIQTVSSDLGNRLGPIFESIGSYLRNIFGPVIEGIRSAFSKVANAIRDNEDNLRPLWDLMRAVGAFARDTLAPIIGKTLGAAFSGLGSILSGVVTTIGFLVDKMRDAYNWAKNLIDRLKGINLNPFSKASFTSAGFVTADMGGGGGGISIGGGGGGDEPSLFSYGTEAERLAVAAAEKRMNELTERLANMPSTLANQDKFLDLLEQQAQATIDFQKAQKEYLDNPVGGATVPWRDVNITVQGTVIDPEGTARAISNVITDSAGRTGDYANIGQARIGLRSVFA